LFQGKVNLNCSVAKEKSWLRVRKKGKRTASPFRFRVNWKEKVRLGGIQSKKKIEK